VELPEPGAQLTFSDYLGAIEQLAIRREAIERAIGECHKVCVRQERMEPHAFNTREEDLTRASLF
jgi:hypothetical protein